MAERGWMTESGSAGAVLSQAVFFIRVNFVCVLCVCDHLVLTVPIEQLFSGGEWKVCLHEVLWQNGANSMQPIHSNPLLSMFLCHPRRCIYSTNQSSSTENLSGAVGHLPAEPVKPKPFSQRCHSFMNCYPTQTDCVTVQLNSLCW